MLKVRGTELRQAHLRTADGNRRTRCRAVLTRGAVPRAADEAAPSPRLVALAANYLDSRKVSIYGGTNEVQRNLISTRVLQCLRRKD